MGCDEGGGQWAVFEEGGGDGQWAECNKKMIINT